MPTENKHDKQVQDKLEIMRGYDLIMSKIYNFLTLYLLSALISKAHQQIISEVKANHSPILDIGCGTGTQLLMLTRKVNFTGEIFGIDLSREMLKISRKRKNKMPNKINLILADAEYLPFKNEAFEFVTSAGVLRFLPNPEKMFNNTYRVLKKQGIFILRDFAGPSQGIREIQHFPLPFLTRFTVWRLRSDEHVKALFEKSGFLDVLVYRKGRIPHVPVAMGGLYRTNMFAKGTKPPVTD